MLPCQQNRTGATTSIPPAEACAKNHRRYKIQRSISEQHGVVAFYSRNNRAYNRERPDTAKQDFSCKAFT